MCERDTDVPRASSIPVSTLLLPNPLDKRKKSAVLACVNNTYLYLFVPYNNVAVSGMNGRESSYQT